MTLKAIKKSGREICGVVEVCERSTANSTAETAGTGR